MPSSSEGSDRAPVVVRSEREGPLWVIALRGDFDPEFIDLVEEATTVALVAFDGPLVFDLREVGFCDSSLLNHLIRTKNRRPLALVGANGSVRRLLIVTGLDPHLPCHPDLDAACDALVPGPLPCEQA
ncbi:STAS domain-containing protein [Streptomyces sp. NPDC046985]|uniref:STAS domain-containing protein n=1 Tax=Streptomyces sp. NPDC046985 TaxID=3155377 RepID=UPI0033F6C676